MTVITTKTFTKVLRVNFHDMTDDTGEYEIGVQEAGNSDEWSIYHPHAGSEDEAEESAMRKARRDGYEKPIVYMASGPH